MTMRTGLPPLVLAGLAGLLMWLVARLVPQLSFQLPFGRALPAVIAVAGFSIGILGAMSFRRARTTLNPMRPERASTLVTSGIFSATRNPMYLGALLMIIAWGLYLSNMVGLLLAPPLFVLYLNRFQIAPEERALTAAFGDEFVDFARRVRRWI